MLSLTCLVMPINNAITQTIFVVLFTSGLLLIWGKPLDTSSNISPRYLSATYSQLTISLLLQTSYDDRLCFLLTGVRQVREGPCPSVGASYHLFPLAAIPPTIHNPIRAVLPDEPQGLGEKQKVHQDITYLLVLAGEEATWDRKYGLSTIWVNPFHARVHSIEEAVRELTAWVSSGPNWPYALVQLNEDTCHVPLPKEGHLGILPQGEADMTAFEKISQMEVCQLLTSGLQVAYPVGLNGHEDPIIISLPKSLANSISLTGGKSVYLEIDILQPLAKELDKKASPLGRCSTIIISTPLTLEREVSMTMEVRNLLSQVILDTSGHGSGDSTPKRPNPVVVLTPLPHKQKDLPKLVDTSS